LETCEAAFADLANAFAVLALDAFAPFFGVPAGIMSPTACMAFELPVPLEKVSQFAYDRGQLVLFVHACVDQLPHPSDLHLLDDHHQE
jgi:hypothetical protein